MRTCLKSYLLIQFGGDGNKKTPQSRLFSAKELKCDVSVNTIS